LVAAIATSLGSTTDQFPEMNKDWGAASAASNLRILIDTIAESLTEIETSKEMGVCV
jgi:hypothetical protein